MTYEFSGKTEKEAIEKAMFELGLERDSFDVEILEAQRGGLFKKGYVKIRLHTNDPVSHTERAPREHRREEAPRIPAYYAPLNDEFERQIVEFVTVVLEKMDMPGSVSVQSRERRKITLNIESQDSAVIIGKKGRTMDALQVIATLYARKISKGEVHIIMDCEHYRLHHEEALVKLALSAASKVLNGRHSILLEPMNPYDRRVIHTTLDKNTDVETRSEGDGTFKQVRVSLKGKRSKPER